MEGEPKGDGNGGKGPGEGGGGSGPPKPTGDTGKTFTQSEVDAIAGRARAEEREKYPDYDTFKDRAAKADELERANMSDVEKKDLLIGELQRKNIASDSRVSEMAIATDIRVKAVGKGFHDPADAVALIDRSGITYTEEAGVTGVDAALDALVVGKGHLVGEPVKAPNINPGTGEPVAATVVLTGEQKVAAKAMGMSEETYAAGLAKPNTVLAEKA